MGRRDTITTWHIGEEDRRPALVSPQPAGPAAGLQPRCSLPITTPPKKKTMISFAADPLRPLFALVSPVPSPILARARSDHDRSTKKGGCVGARESVGLRGRSPCRLRGCPIRRDVDTAPRGLHGGLLIELRRLQWVLKRGAVGDRLTFELDADVAFFGGRCRTVSQQPPSPAPPPPPPHTRAHTHTYIYYIQCNHPPPHCRSPQLPGRTLSRPTRSEAQSKECLLVGLDPLLRYNHPQPQPHHPTNASSA